MRCKIVLALLIISLLFTSTACASPIAEKEPIVGDRETVTVHADYPWYKTIKELYDTADLVVEGNVLDSRVEWMNHAIEPSEEDKDDPRLNPGGDHDSGETITTIYTVDIHDIYKGSTGETIELMQIGGETDTVICTYPDAANIEIGAAYVLFLSASSLHEKAAWLLNPVQAIYRVDGGRLIGAIPLTYEDLNELSGSSYTSIPTIQDIQAGDVEKIEEYYSASPPDIPTIIMEDPADIRSCLDSLQGILIIGAPEEDWPDPEEIAPGAWSDYIIHCRDGHVIEIHFMMERVDFGEGYYPYERVD